MSLISDSPEVSRPIDNKTNLFKPPAIEEVLPKGTGGIELDRAMDLGVRRENEGKHIDFKDFDKNATVIAIGNARAPGNKVGTL